MGAGALQPDRGKGGAAGSVRPQRLRQDHAGFADGGVSAAHFR